MRNRQVLFFVVAVLMAAALSGCARPKDWLTTQNAEVRSFYFGETGAAKITIMSSLRIADFPSTLLPSILTEAFQERLRARGLSTEEAKPSAGGLTTLDEFKLNGRRFTLEVTWAESGALLVLGAYHQEGRKTAHLHVWNTMPAAPSQYYKDEESFYHGLKADIGPVIDKALGDILPDFAARGLARP